MTDNFGWGELAKIERNDDKLLRRSIEEYTRVNRESVKQYARIVWASLISSLVTSPVSAYNVGVFKKT